MKRSEALKLRGIVEKAVTSLDDKIASEAATLFPRWNSCICWHAH